MDFKALFNTIIAKNFKELSTKELSLLVRHKTLSIENNDAEAVMEKLENEFNTANELRKNSVANTSGAAGGAADFVPENVTVSTLIDLNSAGESYGFLARLMGKQMLTAKKVTVPVIGRPGKAKILAESATSAQFRAAKEGLQSANTGKVEIEAKKVYNNIQITDELRKYSVIELDALFIGRLKDGILLAAGDAIINADSDDTVTNINYKGTKPSEVPALGYADEARYQCNNGLRKSALKGAAGVTKIDVGVPEGVNDIFKLQALVTSTSNPAKKLILMDQKTYYAYLEKEDFKDAAKNGIGSTIFTGAMTNIGGSDIFVTDLISLAGTDGYVSATAGDNVTGSILVFDLTAIQHGDYEDLKFNVEADFAIGELFEAYGYWGFANMQNKDGLVFVAIGFDVTLS